METFGNNLDEKSASNPPYSWLSGIYGAYQRQLATSDPTVENKVEPDRNAALTDQSQVNLTSMSNSTKDLGNSPIQLRCTLEQR